MLKVAFGSAERNLHMALMHCAVLALTLPTSVSSIFNLVEYESVSLPPVGKHFRTPPAQETLYGYRLM